MKLKDSTFAIIAEKKDSISHKWFNDNCFNLPTWGIGYYYLYNSKDKNYEIYEKAINLPENIPIYTESEFEALLKAEQENESTQTFGGKISIGKNAQIFPAKGDGNITLELVSPLSEMKDLVKSSESNQITISYNLALEYIAERLGVDKGILKIENCT